MTFFNVMTFSEQGVYNVVDNLGSLLARFLFQPIEETFYTFFAGLLGRGGGGGGGGDDGSSIDADGSGDGNSDAAGNKKNTAAVAAENVAVATKTLQTLFKFVVLVGLTVAAFAQGPVTMHTNGTKPLA